MNEKSQITGGASSRVGNKIASCGLLLVALLLAFALSSAGPMTPASAAPAEQAKLVTYRYRARLDTNPMPFCVGRMEPIAVRVGRQATVSFGQKTSIKYTPLPRLYVQTQVADESIGTMDPRSSRTGGRGDHNSEFGGASFYFHPLKAGKTQIDSKVLIPADMTGTENKWVSSDPVPIEVVNCEYSVYMSLTGTVSTGGLRGSLIRVMGETGLKREWPKEDYEGDGTFNPYFFIESASGCTIWADLKAAPTHITGHLANGELVLKFKEGSGTSQGATQCQGRTVSLGGSWVGGPNPEYSVAFPENGGTRTFTTAFPGFTGTTTITVVPKNK